MTDLELILVMYGAACSAALITTNAMHVQKEEGTPGAVMGALMLCGFCAFIFYASVAADMALRWLWSW